MVDAFAVVTVGVLIALGLRGRFGTALLTVVLVSALGALLLSAISLTTLAASPEPWDMLTYTFVSFALFVAISILALGPPAFVRSDQPLLRSVLGAGSLGAWLVAVLTLFVYPVWGLAGLCLPPGATYTVLMKDGDFETLCEIPALWGPLWMLVVVLLYVAAAVTRLPELRKSATQREDLTPPASP